MTTAVTAAFSSFSDMLKAGLATLVDQEADGFLSMMAEDAVMEFPFAPDGFPCQIRGRAELAAYLGRFAELLELSSVTPAKTHRTSDPGVVVFEFTATGRGVRTGRPYNQSYISVITARDGRIVRYQDYWNPPAALDTIGGSQAWTASTAGAEA